MNKSKQLQDEIERLKEDIKYLEIDRDNKNWNDEMLKLLLKKKEQLAFKEYQFEIRKQARKELLDEELKWLLKVVPYVTEKDIIMEFENRIKEINKKLGEEK